MANRYWVGSSGADWNDAANWSATSGGAGGAGIPTSADNAYIDSITSLTLTGTGSCASLILTAINTFTVTGTLNIHGPNLTVGLNNTITGGGYFAFQGNVTVSGTYGSLGVNVTCGSNTISSSARALTLTASSKLDLSDTTTDAGEIIAGFIEIDNTTFTAAALVEITTTAQGTWAPSSGEPALSINYDTVTNSTGYNRIDIYVSSPGTGVTKVIASTGSNTSAACANLGLDLGIRVSADQNGGVIQFTGLHFRVVLTSDGSYTYQLDEICGSLSVFGSNQPVSGTSVTLKTVSGQPSNSKTLTTTGTSKLPTLNFNNLSGSPATYQCESSGSSNFTISGDVNFNTANSDVLDIRNDKILICDTFNNSGTNVRAIDFSNSASAIRAKNYTSATSTNLTITGTPNIQMRAPATLTTNTFTSGSITTYNVSVASDSTGGTLSLNGNVNNLTLLNASYSVSATLNIYGSLTLASSPTVSGGSFTFVGTSGTQVITSNGGTIDQNVTINASSATIQIADTFAMGSARTLTLTAGTLDFNSANASMGVFSSSNSNSRAISFGGSTVTITGSGTAWNCGTSTNLSVTAGTGTISLTSASAKTFAGGGKSWPSVNQGGTGTLSITGNNTFANFTNTVNSCTIAFPTGTTTFSNFNVRGVAGGLVTLSSTSTLSKASGTVAVNYLNLSNSTATGGADWYAGSGSVDGGGNTGWLFSSASTGGFLAFF